MDQKRQKIDNSTSDSKILKYINSINTAENDKHEVTDYNEDWLRKTISQIDFNFKENETLRSKYPYEPLKFLGTEANLNSLLKDLTNFAISNDESLPEKLIKLLEFEKLFRHENDDIKYTVTLILQDLIQDEESKVLELLNEKKILELIISELDRCDNEELLKLVIELVLILSGHEQFQSKLIKNGQFIKFNNYLLKNNTEDNESIIDSLLDIQYNLITYNSSLVLKYNQDLIEILLINLSKLQLDSPEDSYLSILITNLSLLIKSPEGYKLFKLNEGYELFFHKIIHKSWGFKPTIVLVNSIFDLNSNVGQQGIIQICNDLINSNEYLKNINKSIKSYKNTIEELYKILKNLTFLLNYLKFNSTERIRLFNKLTDSKFINLLESLETLYDVFESYEFEDEDYLGNFDDGLNLLQLISIIKLWLLAEDTEIKDELLTKHKKFFNLNKTKEIIKGYKDELNFNLDNSESREVKVALENDIESINELMKTLNA
ncbi:hypothetical protein WICMUC_004975 [Wickerhamomyces mucosus]|uniref:Beta-catenin-like protein 1 N-terminal domain-containing protein n=1 Tax=Wickerhamomyces mucosus TaxID=1378264 RepID=A0A9P8PC61_9ASCO|nr:hypothetical protein WICMUC_004975 [Wickerhamomyces mucosus]